MFTGIIYISQNCLLMIIYIYTLRVFVCSIAIVWLTGQHECCMFACLILLKETLFLMT